MSIFRATPLVVMALLWSSVMAFVLRPGQLPSSLLGMAAGKGFGSTKASQISPTSKTKKKKKKESSAPIATISSEDLLPPPRVEADSLASTPATLSSPADAPKEYPPLTKDEIAQWMVHVPVYVVTDEGGENAQAISLGDNQTVVYLFVSSVVAEAYRTTLQASKYNNHNKPLLVSGMFLGKIWFDLLQPSQPSEIEYRLVPDPRDLTSARTVLDLETARTEEVPSGTDPEKEEGFEWVEDLPAFSQPFNEIPLFYVDHMPLGKQSKQVQEFLNQMVSTKYMFFSTQNMFQVLEEIQTLSPQEETTSNNHNSDDALCSLYEVVAMMQEPSEIDFRNLVLVPPTPIEEGTVSDAVLAKQLEDPSSLLSQTYFLPLLQGSEVLSQDPTEAKHPNHEAN